MTSIRFRSDCTVELVDHMGNDERVVRAARVSTGNDEEAANWDKQDKLINYLMKNRHGSPFEKGVFEFRIECPIFVAREFFRHRLASYNEESARYKKLDGVFWIPAPSRPLVQEGKSGHYIMKPGTMDQYKKTKIVLEGNARRAYEDYEYILGAGITREVARGCLPVSIYTSFYVTMNARSLMNFLSLRIDDPDSTFPSKPQYEIQQVAEQMEDIFHRKMPLTHSAFKKNGRVCP